MPELENSDFLNKHGLSCSDYNKILLIQNLEKIQLDKKSKLLSFSIYNSKYTRTESIHALFDELDISYQIINYYPKSYPLRYFLSLFKLIKEIKNCDAIYVHFRWFEILPFIWIIAKIFRKKIIFDHFISIWDTICFDRQKVKPYGVLWNILKSYDKLLIEMSDLIILDTNTHLNFFIKELWLPMKKWWYVHVGCNEKLFKPLQVPKHDKFTVFWYGNVQPIQGVKFILDIAKSLEWDPDIRFELVWPIRRKLNIKANYHENITFIDWLDYKKLPIHINKSHVCIWWHFSKIWKAQRVIAWKSFQFISCWIPTILADNQANREVFNEKHKNVYFSKIWDIKECRKIILKIKNETTTNS